MTTDPLDLDRLVELAEAATPGPWVHATGTNRVTRRIVSGEKPKTVADVRYVNGKADAAYIAAVSPSTVLALVREVRRARTALEMVRDWQDFDSALGIETLREEVAAALRVKP